MSEHPSKPRATAGLRGAGWDPKRMARAFQTSPVALRTADDQRSLGLLYSQTGREKTVVCLMHPREFTGTPYLVPDVLDAGCAAWVQAPRSIGNDLRLEHEAALLDVAAGMVHLRAQGFERVVLLGNSGGASLYAFYIQQSSLQPDMRLRQTPGGRPIHLAGADMPEADELVLVSPHPGQGALLMNALDPSVTDESDAFSTDPSLDPFDATNGFAQPPQSSCYSADFVQRYRLAQRARAQRMDDWARRLIHERHQARHQSKSGQATADNRRRGAHTPIMQMWRTDADLRCWDVSLDPSDRAVGTLWGRDPWASNWGSVGFARLLTPESWLSTWSGISTNASFAKCGAAIQMPTQLIEYTGDQAAFPSDMNAIYENLGTTQKERHRVRGNHHGHALAEGEPSGQVLVGKLVQQWLQETH